MNNRGISMIEMVVAVTILSVSTLMVISSFYGIGSIGDKTSVYNDAMLVTKNIFEEIRVTGNWSSDEYVKEDGKYIYNKLEFEVKKQNNGETEIIFYTGNSEKLKSYKFWVAPSKINEVKSDEG